MIAVVVTALACLVAVLPASRAQAMFDGPAYAFPVPDYVSGLIGAAALNHASGGSGSSSSGKGTSKKPSKRKKAKAKPKRPTAAQRRKLRFTESPTVTARVDQTLVERTGVDPAVLLPQLDAARTEWRRVLAKVVKWSPRDLGDVAAFTFLQLNRLYRGQAVVDARAAEAIRKQVRDDLARLAAVRRLAASRKQEASEVLRLRTTLLASTIEQRRELGDAAAVDAAEEEIRDFTREVFDIDLRKVKVGKKGLKVIRR